VNATWTCFDSANLIGAYLWNGDFEYASFARTGLPGKPPLVKGTRIRSEPTKSFIDDDLEDQENPVQYDGANFRGSSFRFATLTGLDFGTSDLSDVEFVWCDLRQADLKNVNFSGLEVCWGQT
jgi:hypothetical protein